MLEHEDQLDSTLAVSNDLSLINRANGDDEYLLPRPLSNWQVDRKGRVRDAECARLKAMGYTLADIAHELGLDKPRPENATRRVAAAIKRALGEMARFAGDEMRLMELHSLDELEWAAWRTLQVQHVVISQGRVVIDQEGEVIRDDRFVLEVIDRILKIKERRAKLMGLDAPTRAEVLTIDSIEAEISKLEREVRAAAADNE